jgi:uncharacterized protein (TIGR02722 family)
MNANKAAIKASRAAMLLALAVVLAASCGKRVSRVGAGEQIDLSGRWNDTDSQMVADAMIKDSMTFPWIDDFRGSNSGQKPVVIAYGVANRTSEHINTQTFMKDLERAFLRSGRVTVVADSDQRRQIRDERAEQQQGLTANPAAIGKETGANFVLTGVLNSIKDREGGEEVVFYQANLELINVENNEKVWIGDHKIKKFVSRSGTTY